MDDDIANGTSMTTDSAERIGKCHTAPRRRTTQQHPHPRCGRGGFQRIRRWAIDRGDRPARRRSHRHALPAFPGQAGPAGRDRQRAAGASGGRGAPARPGRRPRHGAVHVLLLPRGRVGREEDDRGIARRCGHRGPGRHHDHGFTDVLAKLLARAQAASAVRDDVTTDDLAALPTSTTQGAVQGGWNPHRQQRVLSIIFAGLHPH
ncbi:hypothetical protein BJY24_005805 [Nocardia transvalensis]|uniref:Transcriptional regulator SbtR-like C-terminal domain-containing protein n=1 Tax=Nocardia transvalensis TaxID=37333 RepID=A0A7W9UKT7_9NOCA|nr:hypothetical protein [Nocardia transvalensis]